ncbi:MAG: pilus assembly protein TadG-related protein [Desulfobacteraceae bacterium]|jgi:hypothetical protein
MKYLYLDKTFKSQTGSFGVAFALFLVVLVGVLAFVINLGYLYAGKNKYQNAVEAAAMAGAACLCDDSPELTARQILLENLFSDDYSKLPEGYTLEIRVGYYDEWGDYDFSGPSEYGYRSFIEEENIPDAEYVNSLFVRLTIDNKTILPGFLGDNENTPVQAAAIAYRQGYDLLSYGDPINNGIRIEHNWPEDRPPRLEQVRRIHSSGDIYCEVTPVMGQDQFITAEGTVTNMPGGISDWPETVDIHPIDWVELRQQAEKNGRVIRIKDFRDYRENIIPNEYITDETGNRCYELFKPNKPSISAYPYIFHDGDHEGKVYFFSAEGALSTDKIHLGVVTGEHAYNFTVASELPLGYCISGNDYIGGELGGEDNDRVEVFCKEDFGNRTNMTRIFQSGIIYRTEKDFEVFFNDNDIALDPAEQTFFIRVIAEGNIYFKGGTNQSMYAANTAINSNFAPPCGPAEVLLGRIEKVEKLYDRLLQSSF